jgi:hypothetical protein
VAGKFILATDQLWLSRLKSIDLTLLKLLIWSVHHPINQKIKKQPCRKHS